VLAKMACDVFSSQEQLVFFMSSLNLWIMSGFELISLIVLLQRFFGHWRKCKWNFHEQRLACLEWRCY
jgi:hypothetical protein